MVFLLERAIPAAVSVSHDEQPLADLLASADDAGIARRLLEETPWIFRDNTTAFFSWRAAVAGATESSPGGIFVVGSSAFGFSMNPTKPGRAFRHHGNQFEQPSDIDVAIVSDTLFMAAWDAIRAIDRHRSLASSREERDKIRTDVYWGFIGSRNVPRGSSIARILRTAMSSTTAAPPFRGHPATARIYRRHADLFAYHVQSIRELRRTMGDRL